MLKSDKVVVAAVDFHSAHGIGQHGTVGITSIESAPDAALSSLERECLRVMNLTWFPEKHIDARLRSQA